VDEFFGPNLAEGRLQPREHNVVLERRQVEFARRRIERTDAEGGQTGLIVDVFLFVNH
jgi:hypothetical protein